jgi:hypothetical protein
MASIKVIPAMNRINAINTNCCRIQSLPWLAELKDATLKREAIENFCLFYNSHKKAQKAQTHASCARLVELFY